MNQKGSTIFEVIISFVIIVIITQMVITSFLRSDKVIKNNERKENVINEVNNIFNLFSADPVYFIDNLDIDYKIVYDDNLYYLYYDYLFKENSKSSNNYIVINYYKNNNIYTLIISVYLNNQLHNKYNNLQRSIRYER
jgi:hypothetical protein